MIFFIQFYFLELTQKYKINSVETKTFSITPKPRVLPGYGTNGATTSQGYSQMTSTNYTNGNSEGASRPINHVNVSHNNIKYYL